MPRRSNARQAIVYLVRKHMAHPGTEVRESEFLRDAVTGECKEVDVVVRALADGDPVVISIEVTDRQRRVDRPWVEQMVKKHDRLPTNSLVLVSWSGFTKTALAAVAAEGGRVVAMSPEQVEEHGLPLAQTCRRLAVGIGWPTEVWVAGSDAEGTLYAVEVQLGAAIRDSAGRVTGNCADMAWKLLERAGFRAEVEQALRAHGTALDGAAYNAERVGLSADGWYLEIPGAGLIGIEKARVAGVLRVDEVEVELWLTRLGVRQFRSGVGTFLDRRAVWVAVTDAGGAERLVFRDF